MRAIFKIDQRASSKAYTENQPSMTEPNPIELN